LLLINNLTFLSPWVLTGLLTLPVFWWFFRITPPVPSRVKFPPIAFMKDFSTSKQTSLKSPWWLILLRVSILLAIILYLARPVLYAEFEKSFYGPLILVVDDGWTAAPDWGKRRDTMVELVNSAAYRERGVIVITTASDLYVHEAGLPILNGKKALEIISSLEPKPWAADWSKTVNRLENTPTNFFNGAEIIWLSDGLELKNSKESLLKALQERASVRVMVPREIGTIPVLRRPKLESDGFKILLERSGNVGNEIHRLVGRDSDGFILVSKDFRILDGKQEVLATVKLPAGAQNRLARLELFGVRSAASTVLLDNRWSRHPIGIVDAGIADSQPLLAPNYFLERAFTGVAEIRKNDIEALLSRPLAVLVLSDMPLFDQMISKKIQEWVTKGGVLLHFAGPSLAHAVSQNNENYKEMLLPVKLRAGSRMFGGTMSWNKSGTLSPFPDSSPFFALSIPDDVTVRRQVVAEPTFVVDHLVWASLSDGSPLVTCDDLGKGKIVLVHTTANSAWSNLAMSGLFVEMLERIVGVSQGVIREHDSNLALQPLKSLDAFGQLGQAAPSSMAIPARYLEDINVGPNYPPGIYGDKEAWYAINLGFNIELPKPIVFSPEIDVTNDLKKSEINLRTPLLIIVLSLFIIDLLVSFNMRGALASFLPGLGALIIVFCFTKGGYAEEDKFALKNSLETRIAYVKTGNSNVDKTSLAGLAGLNTILRHRTSVELGVPQEIDLLRDELVFFPLIYFPIVEGHALAQEAQSNLISYMRYGGIVLLDARDPLEINNWEAIRLLVRRLNSPKLIPLPEDHVLTRTFYLTTDFPGRWAGGTLWVELADERVFDGVSSIIVGGNDWASAWAIDDQLRPINPVIPGGARQRELAYRFGVNLVMYALTGNYKSDQVHTPLILQRLGK